MTKTEAIKKIEGTITKYGFESYMDSHSQLPQIKEDLSISIYIREQIDFEACDFEKRVATFKIEISSSICRMGGNPKPEELFKAADEIRRGAELTEELQKMQIRYSE